MNNIQINHSDLNISVKDIITAHKSSRAKNHLIKQSDRKSFGFVLTLSGSAIYDYGHKKITVSKNTVLFVRKGESYTVNIPTDEGWEHIIVAFDLWDDREIKNFPFETVNKISHQKKLEDIFICENYIWGSSVSKIRAKSLVYEIFAVLLENIESEMFENSKYSGIYAAARYIESNYKEKISVKRLSEISGYSISHFPRLFKNLYGASPNEYIINTRIIRAKNMLRAGTFTLSEIAEKCGFSNVYYFSRIFKKYVGITPKSY